MTGHKVVPLDRLAGISARAREAGKTVVTTNGCFDLLHVGHLQYLEEARAQGDLLLVGVNADASVRALKGAARPLVRASERARLLAGFSAVDFVFIFDEPDPVAFIRLLKPHVHVKGGNYSGRLLEQEAVEAAGGRVKILSLVPGASTTGLVEKIQRFL